jgi:hypothetical protein
VPKVLEGDPSWNHEGSSNERRKITAANMMAMLYD